MNDLGLNLYIAPSISHLVTNSEDLGIERDNVLVNIAITC